MTTPHSEHTIQNLIRLSAAKQGITLFRDNVGVAPPFTPNGHPIRYGLCVGASDLVGYMTIPVCQLSPNARVAVFVAVEVKTPNHRTSQDRLEAQQNFLERVNMAGGLGVMATSVEEFEAAVKQYREGKIR